MRVTELLNFYYPFPKKFINKKLLEESIDYGNKIHKEIETIGVKNCVWNQDIRDLLNDFMVLFEEKNLTHKKYVLSGKPDLIMKDNEGNYLIIDYKTSKKVSDRYLYQLNLYKELLLNNKHVKRKSIKAVFMVIIIKNVENPKGKLVRVNNLDVKYMIKEHCLTHQEWNSITL